MSIVSNNNFIYSFSQILTQGSKTITNFNSFLNNNSNITTLGFSNTNLATVINSNLSLTAPINLKYYWAPSGNLSKTLAYAFIIDNSVYFMIISQNSTDSKYYIKQNLNLSSTGTLSTNKSFFTNSFIALLSATYNSTSTNTLTVYNKNNYPINLTNLNLYLGTTNNYNSTTLKTATNPASITINKNSTNITLVPSGNKYNLNSITLDAGDSLSIILNVATSTTLINTWGSTNSSILLIDLIGLLYVPVTYNSGLGLNLSLSDTNFYYNNLQSNTFNVTFKPANINAENLNNQYVSFNIVDSSGNNLITPIYSQISSGETSFTIPSTNSLNIGKTYNAFINYDPNNSDNSSKQGTNTTPDSTSHYLAGKSNVVSFTLNNENTMITNTSLETSYSVLKTYTFTNFKLMDSNYTSKDLSNTVTGKIKLTYTDSQDATSNPLTYSTNTGYYINNFSVNLKDIKLVPNRIYTLKVDFTPDNIYINSPSTLTINNFITEKPNINISQTLSDLSYFDTNTITVNFKDSFGNYYNTTTNNQGSLNLNIYNGTITTPILSTSSFTLNDDKTIYTYSFSPKTINLLHNYSSANYSIKAIYTETSIPSNINTSSILAFTFKGVSVQQSDLSSLINLNVYSPITLTAFLVDNKLINNSSSLPNYSVAKISTLTTSTNYIGGNFKLYLDSTPIDISPSTTDNTNYNFTFTPHQLSLNTGNNPINNIKIIFIPSDINNVIGNLLIPSFNLQLITPTLTLIPGSTNNNYLYGSQSYNLIINGITGNLDNGILTIYKDDNITTLQSFSLSTNTTSTISIIPHDLLTYSSINPSTISYTIGWTSTNSNIYSDLKTTKSITLSKETINFSTILDYTTKHWGDSYTITGYISTSTNELISGSINIYSVNSDNTNQTFDEISYNLTEGTNNFSISLTNSTPQDLTLFLKFIPNKTNVYTNNKSNNFNVKFNKIEINPILNIYDLDLRHNAYLTNPIFYTENLQIQLSNISLPSYKVTLYIGEDINTNIFTYTDDNEVTLPIHNININLFEYNSTNEIYDSETGITYLIGYSLNEYNNSLYHITYTSQPNIKFKNSIASFNTIHFYDNSNKQLPDTNLKLIYNNDYSIHFTFKSFTNSDSSIIPIIGELYINIDDTKTLLNSEYDSTSTESISFNPTLSTGIHSYYFSFIPSDPNISKFDSSTSRFTIISSSIEEEISVSFSKDPLIPTSIYFQEDFYTILSFNNLGLDGHFEVYCVNSTNLSYILTLDNLTDSDPTNETNPSDDFQLNNNKYISSTSSSEYYYINGTITIGIPCNFIPQDITSESSSQDYFMYIKFITSNDKYESKTFSYYKITVNKINVKLDSLSLSLTSGGTSLDYQNVISVYTNDTIYIKGSVITIDNKPVEGGFIDILTNNIISSEYSTDNLVESIIVANDGKFENSLVLDTSSLLYLNSVVNQTYGTTVDLQFVYRNSKNYILTYFNNDANIPGYYSMEISIPTLNYTLTLENSTNTIIKSFYYQEDNITFTFDLPLLVSTFNDSSLNYSLNLYFFGTDSNGDIFPFNSYTLSKDNFSESPSNHNRTIGTFRINPLINYFPSTNNPYSISAIFSGNGYNDSSPSNITSENIPKFNIIKTIPKISVYIYSTGTHTVISSTNYETSVDLFIKVNTDKPVISSNSNSINGTFSVYLLIKNGSNSIRSNDSIHFTYTGQTTPTNTYTFDNTNLSKDGIIVTFSPKNNLKTMEITDLSSIVGFEIDFTPTDTDNYESKIKSTSFTINKYLLSLSIISIQPNIDNQDPTENINNPSNYYGYINFDEEFNVTTSINLPLISGTYNYYYSSDSSNYTSIVKLSSSNDANNLITLFSRNMIPIDNDNSYNFKVGFNPTESNYYNSIENIKAFNVYLANNFGRGTIAYYNNASSSLIASYNSSNTINITASFIFDNSVEESAKICSVKLYYTKTSEPSNKILLTNNVIYLTNNNNSATFNLNSYILPTNLANSPYTIKALFTPVISVNSEVHNNNYPVIYEQSPLTLVVKPSISITNLNSSYNYGLPISFKMVFNTGTDGTFNDYNKFNLSIQGTLKNASNNLIIDRNLSPISFNPALITDNTYTINNINLDPSLIPDNYTISIYANGSISSTETTTGVFEVKKFSVTLSGSIDKYYIKYGNPLAFTFNIGEYVIDNGFVNILFKNVSNSDGNKSISIPSTSLSRSGFYYTYTISDTSIFFSKSLPVGIYTLTYSLDNQNYTSVDYTDLTSNLFVNPIDCNLSLTYSAEKINYGTSNNIVITANITTTSSSIIRDATLYLTANGNSTPMLTTIFNNTDNKYILTLPSTSLNIGINEICVYMLHPNYITKPVLKMITVTKGVPSTSYTITNDISTNTSTSFKIVLDQNMINSQTVTFYTDISNSVINPESISGRNYTFLFSQLLYGDNYIYAIINSPQFDTKTNSLKIVKPLKNVTITCSPSIADRYKSGTPLDITYLISSSTDTISEGFVEFYRSFAENTELIGVVNVTNGSATLEDYILYGDSDINNDNTTTFKIHGKYIGTNKYNSATSIDSVLTIFNQYSSSIAIESILYSNNSITSGDTLKVNSNIMLKYKVAQNSPASDYRDGVIEFHSKYNDSTSSTVVDEILGYSTLNSDLIGTLTYNLINIGTINIYAKYINANNYSDSNSSSQLFTINVERYYQANIEDLTEYNVDNTYNINDSIDFSFNVKDNSDKLIKEGGVELHMISIKLDGSDGDDDILNYQLLSTDEVNFTYYFYNSGSYKFYGKFLNSNNYETDSTIPKLITILPNQIKEVSINYNSSTDLLNINPISEGNTYKLGDTISLYYDINDVIHTENKINDGSIVIFKEYNGHSSSPEIIGMYEVAEGVAGTTYILNFNENFIVDNKNSVSFYATYCNSEIYSENVTSIIKTSIYVIKQYNATISTAIVTPSTNLIVGDSVKIEFTVKNNSDANVSDGILEVHKVHNNFDEIIGYTFLSSANYINYTLVDNGDIYFYAYFNDSINYANTTNLDSTYPVTITTKQQYLTSTVLTTSTTALSYGTILRLTANVTGSDCNNLNINDGNVNFYIVTTDPVTTDPVHNTSSINEFIGSSYVTNGSASIDYYINKVGPITFLASFENSIKFADSISTNLTLISSKASPISINISYPSTIHYLDIITIKATVDFGTNLYFSNNGTITFTVNGEEFEVNLIKSDGNTYIANLEQIIYDRSYAISAKFNGNDLFKDIISSQSNINKNSIIVNTEVYNSLTITYVPSSLTNYIILTAALNIKGNPNNKNVLKNTGYITFEPKLVGTEFIKYTYPMINGSATANLPFIYSDDFEINVTYNDKDPSDISNNITIDKIFKIEVPVAIGGKTKTTSAYNYHVFTSSDNIIFTKNANVHYLVIAGGGAGGSNHGGGGGSGGVLSGSTTIPKGNYIITVGLGGIIESNKSNKGNNSSFFSIESTGGGNGGGAVNGIATNGGSGGGEGGYHIGIGPYGKGITGQGYDGGSKPDDQNSAGSGGGGSGGNGLTYTNNEYGGLGGNGTNRFDSWLKDISPIMSESWINATKYSSNGTDVYYIAGGGAGGSWNAPPTKGTLGGGGTGGSYINGPPMPTSGVDNTGSGGGGGGAGGQRGANGGSGIVIIRYPV